MAKLEEIGISGLIGSGILQPQFKHLFRVEWMVDNLEVRQALQIQAIRVNIDYATKELSITYEQPALGPVAGMMHETLFNACKSPDNIKNTRKHTIRVTAMGGNEDDHYVIDYFCWIKGCHYDLDYACGGKRECVCEVHADFHITDVVYRGETAKREDSYEAAMKTV